MTTTDYAIRKRSELKERLAEIFEDVRMLKLRLHENYDPQLARDLKQKKRQLHELELELGNNKRLMDRKEMRFSVAFLQAAKRLLPAPIFRELRLATYDYRELEDDADVEEMLLERREYVEEAVRGVRY